MEGLNNKIRLIQRRAYGIKDQEYLMLKVITSFIQDKKVAWFTHNKVGRALTGVPIVLTF